MHDPFGFLVFFVLHSPVLEPDLYLALRQVQKIGHFHPAWAAEIAVEMKLLLQLHQLRAGIGGADSLGSRAGGTFIFAVVSCRRKRNKERVILV